MDKFKADIQSGKFRTVVEKDVKDGFEAAFKARPPSSSTANVTTASLIWLRSNRFSTLN